MILHPKILADEYDEFNSTDFLLYDDNAYLRELSSGQIVMILMLAEIF